MKEINKKEFKKIIQSGHINLFIGSGCSTPFLETLGSIEKEMNDQKDESGAKKKYYALIKKSKAILHGIHPDGVASITLLNKTKGNYDSFLSFWAKTISSRYLHILNKQVNIFTTNFDMFMEASCECIGIQYNDGFAGRINPVFDVANFNKIQRYKSLQFDNISDIPLFNIIKLHGSVSWKTENKKIVYSDGEHIADDLGEKVGDEFDKGYKKIIIVNPNAGKHIKSVVDTKYASMLRKFTLELEKENSILIIIGFSLNDEHIKDLLYGVMNSNPTLIVIYFSHPQYNENTDNLEEKKNPNLYVISHSEDNKCFSLEEVTKYLSDIFAKSDQSEQDENEENEKQLIDIEEANKSLANSPTEPDQPE